MITSLQTILITGGTGSFATAMTTYLLNETNATIRIYSRGEYLQAAMEARFRNDRLRFFLGDVRDEARLRLAMDSVGLVIHCAALKRIEKGEYDPYEFIQTNVIGTYNVISACKATGVQQALFLSTDKAVRAINIYGQSKGLAERLWVRANAYAPHGTKFVVVRYGNVAHSRGSVIPLWRQCLAEGRAIPVTDLSMTRFYIALDEAVHAAMFTINNAPRGGIIVPHLSAYSMRDLAQAVCEESGVCSVSLEHIGVRHGEKRHEQLIGEEEMERLYVWRSGGNRAYYYVSPLAPSWAQEESMGQWEHSALPCAYESGTWPDRLSMSELRGRLKGSHELT